MKKLFLSLFVAGALTFTLQSCGSDEVDACEGVTCAANETCVDGACIPDAVATCDVCGIFDGSADGAIAISITLTDTVFTGVLVSATVTENATAASYNMAIDISSLLGAPAGTLVPDVDGTLAGQTITITNQTYNYQSLADITIDGTVDYDATFVNIDGALALTGDAVGNVTFTGVKQ